MSIQTIRQTATKPYSDKTAPMSKLATEADVKLVENVTDLLGTQAQVDTTAIDLAALKVDFNALLAKLRTAGVLAP